MYSIQTVIYGIPVTDAVSELEREWEQDQNSPWDEDDEGPCGFKKLYSGSSSGLVGYCGVELGELDECGEWVAVQGRQLEYKNHRGTTIIPLEPTPEQIVEAEAKIAKLHPEMRKVCLDPGVYIIYSTS